MSPLTFGGWSIVARHLLVTFVTFVDAASPFGNARPSQHVSPVLPFVTFLEEADRHSQSPRHFLLERLSSNSRRNWHSGCSSNESRNGWIDGHESIGDQKMSRCLTLEEYLQEFVDENTQSANSEEVRLLVTDQQAQTLGYFFINGLAGFVERLRLQRAFDYVGSQSDTNDQVGQNDDADVDEFIN